MSSPGIPQLLRKLRHHMCAVWGGEDCVCSGGFGQLLFLIGSALTCLWADGLLLSESVLVVCGHLEEHVRDPHTRPLYTFPPCSDLRALSPSAARLPWKCQSPAPLHTRPEVNALMESLQPPCLCPVRIPQTVLHVPNLTQSIMETTPSDLLAITLQACARRQSSEQAVPCSLLHALLVWSTAPPCPRTFMWSTCQDSWPSR